MTKPFWSRHRGPFIFCINRPFASKPGFYRTEWLRGRTFAGEEVEAEATALLADERDTISTVDVWSEHEQQFVMTYRRAG